MNTETTFDAGQNDKPDLHWGAFGARFALAVGAIASGTLANAFLTEPGMLAWSIVLALLGAAIMLAIIVPRERHDEFDTAISMRAGTFAGLSTVIFILIMQLYAEASGTAPFAVLALPGFYLTQWLIISQWSRWNAARGDA